MHSSFCVYEAEQKGKVIDVGIAMQELKKLDKADYQLVDMRDEVEIGHGVIEGALVLKPEEIENCDKIDRLKKTVICCSRGERSIEVAERLRERGFDAVSLDGGYRSWLLEQFASLEEKNKAKDVEQSLRKMQRCLRFLLRFLNQIFLTLCIMWKNRPATCVPE